MNIVERLNDDSQCFCSIRKEAAVDIERLQQTVSMLAGDRDLYIEEIKKKNAEIERLREALRAINRKNDNPAWFNPDIYEIVETALQQKESE